MEDLKMTKQQEYSLKRLRAFIERYDINEREGSTTKREFKEWEVRKLEDTDLIAVYSVVGLVEDEGTMASLICRTYRHIFIGKNGGYATYVDKKKGKGSKKVCGDRALWESARY